MLLAGAALIFATASFGSGQGSPTPDSPPPRLEQLRWMVGSWSGESGGVRMEEHWIEPRGGVMLGLHRDLLPDDGLFFEYLRIEQTPEGIVYFASPRGSKTTPFRMLELRGQRVVFHNPEHDFPQRIIYELRDGTTLCARIEGDENNQPKSREWCWKKT
jgi:hypothetical protein